jgi:hypothetical protein
MAEIVSVVAQATTSPSWVDAPTSSAVSESDAARLADLLSTQQAQAQASTPSVAPVDRVAHSDPASGSMGDRILRGMDAVGRAYKEKSVEVNRFLEADAAELSPTRLLRLQAQMLDQSIMVDLWGRGVSKCVQGLEQMAKTQ